MSNLLDKIKQRYEEQSFTKDIAFKDLVQETPKIVITQISTIYVPKYHKLTGADQNDGIFIKLKLLDGRTTGGFNNALKNLARYFLEILGAEYNQERKTINFDGHIELEVTEKKLDSKKTTYDINIIGGDLKALTGESMTQLLLND